MSQPIILYDIPGQVPGKAMSGNIFKARRVEQLKIHRLYPVNTPTYMFVVDIHLPIKAWPSNPYGSNRKISKNG